MRAARLLTVLALTAVLWVPSSRAASDAPRSNPAAPVVPVYPGLAPLGPPAAIGDVSAYTSPYVQWMTAAMGPFVALLNPPMYGQWWGMMANPWVEQMTRHRVLDAMMRGFDPRMLGGPWPGTDGEDDGRSVPERVPLVRIPGFPTQPKKTWRPNTVTEGVSLEAKRRFYQSMMMANPLSMRDMIGIMAHKMPVAEDVSFEDAVEAMKLRANEVNFKLVGQNPLWLDVRAISGDENTPRVEIFQFCDAMVARQILDYVPEFAVFLPCRIALVEDADGQLWVMTLDWDVGWLDYAQNPNSELERNLRAEAQRIRDALQYIMEGGATGEF